MPAVRRSSGPPTAPTGTAQPPQRPADSDDDHVCSPFPGVETIITTGRTGGGLIDDTIGYLVATGHPRFLKRSSHMLVLGLILLLLGIFLKISILQTIGIILLVVGAILFILGAVGRPVGGRRHFF